MKFLIVGDLHGNKPEIHFKDFDAIIAPGDFCSDAPKKYMFQLLKEKLKGKNSGIEWYDVVGKKKAKEMVKKSLSDGRKILEYLNSIGVPVYVVPGNWDWVHDDEEWNFLKKNYYEELIKGLDNVIDVHNKIISVDGYQIIGYGLSSGPEYPQYKKDLKMIKTKKLEKIRKRYERDLKKIDVFFVKAKKPVIFLSHNVPFNTPIDRITNKKSPRYGYHFGSLIAREMIGKHQPLVCVGGHMHEHFGKCKIGKTVCVNTGFGSYVNTFLELDKGVINRLEFYSR